LVVWLHSLSPIFSGMTVLLVDAAEFKYTLSVLKLYIIVLSFSLCNTEALHMIFFDIHLNDFILRLLPKHAYEQAGKKYCQTGIGIFLIVCGSTP
jgi:hypothetical protein